MASTIDFIWVVWGDEYAEKAFLSARQAHHVYTKAGRRDEINLIIYHLENHPSGRFSTLSLYANEDGDLGIQIEHLNVAVPKDTSQVHTPRYHALFMRDRRAFYFDTDVMILKPFPDEVLQHTGLQHFAYSHFGGGWLEGEVSKVQHLCDQPWYDMTTIDGWKENFFFTHEGCDIKEGKLPEANRRTVINSGFAYFGGQDSEKYRNEFIPAMIDECAKSQRWGYDELVLAAMARGGHIHNHKLQIYPGINRMPKIEDMDWKKHVAFEKCGDDIFLAAKTHEASGTGEIAIHTGSHFNEPNVSLQLSALWDHVLPKVQPRIHRKVTDDKKRLTFIWVVWGDRYLPLVVGSAFMAARAYYDFDAYEAVFKVYVIGNTPMKRDQQAFLESHGVIVEHRNDIVVPPNQSRSEEPRFQLMQEHGDHVMYMDADFYLMAPIPNSFLMWKGVQTFGFSPYARVEATIMDDAIRDKLDQMYYGAYPGIHISSYLQSLPKNSGHWTSCFYETDRGEPKEDLMWGQFNLGFFYWRGGPMPWYDDFKKIYEELIACSPYQLTCGELAFTMGVRRGLIPVYGAVFDYLNEIITTREMPWWRILKLADDLGHEVITSRNGFRYSAHVGHYLGNPSMCVRWHEGRLRLFVPPDQYPLYKEDQVFDAL